MRPSVILLIILPVLSACMGDKQKHYAVGVVTQSFVQDQTGSALKGCAASLGLAAAKEVYDSQFGGVVDRGDVTATIASCTLTYRF